jgi:hypothetical protein
MAVHCVEFISKGCKCGVESIVGWSSAVCL